MLKNMSVLDNSLCIALSNDKTLLYSSKAPQEIAYIIEALKKKLMRASNLNPIITLSILQIPYTPSPKEIILA